jgi:YrbI family 3-deoxy-D-manno-octulosonate 8-phosphate phosphatase
MRIDTKNIDLIVYDFDGVMTDNRVVIFQDGREAVLVNRSDGLGVDFIRGKGITQLILSTETNSVVRARAAKLRIKQISACADKKKALLNYCKKRNYNMKKVIYVGNDLNDLEVMKSVGMPVAPADAHRQIKAVAKLITKSKGGQGVIRELAQYFISSL